MRTTGGSLGSQRSPDCAGSLGTEDMKTILIASLMMIAAYVGRAQSTPLASDSGVIGILATDKETMPVLAVEAVQRGSPADKAGIDPGDRILRIDGLNITGMSQSNVVKLIRGEAWNYCFADTTRRGQQCRSRSVRCSCVRTGTCGEHLPGEAAQTVHCHAETFSLESLALELDLLHVSYGHANRWRVCFLQDPLHRLAPACHWWRCFADIVVRDVDGRITQWGGYHRSAARLNLSVGIWWVALALQRSPTRRRTIRR